MKKIIILTFLILSFGCAKKHTDEFNARSLTGKNVAIAHIDGPKEARRFVEVAIVNEVIANGRFAVVDRIATQEAMIDYPAINDRQKLGKKLGADYVLSVQIDDYKVVDRHGYDQVEEEDSVLAEEMHESEVKTKKYYKVKASDALVKIYFSFVNVQTGEVQFSGTGSSSLRIDSRDTKNMGKMHLLEEATNDAVHRFFESLPK